MRFFDTVSMAFRTLKGNKLRTGITVSIIALGIMALVGIFTAIEAMRQKFSDSFSSMGANGFSIRYKERNIRFGGNGNSELKATKKKTLKEKKSNTGKIITWDQAEKFKENYNFPALVSISMTGTRNGTITWKDKKTSPNVRVVGGDENSYTINGFTIEYGRNFSPLDVTSARNVCILGRDVSNKLFGNNPARALDKVIRIGNFPFRVIGVLSSKGSTFGMSFDNMVLTSYTNGRRIYGSEINFNISVKVNDLRYMEAAIGEAQGIFRPIRRLAVTEDDNFIVDKSDSIVEMAMRSLSFLTISAVVIGFITLIGAAIGLMNIMLVAVTERTKEVGLVKAIGGRQKTVRRQFLIEAVLISLFGALFGIFLGVLVGNIFSLVLGTGFVIPWGWVVFGIVICSVVGILAGLYPAIKAGKLNPIEALRYE
jgi:putative ABC transport system permease protein